jgi:hypothetical protein
MSLKDIFLEYGTENVHVGVQKILFFRTSNKVSYFLFFVLLTVHLDICV